MLKLWRFLCLTVVTKLVSGKYSNEGKALYLAPSAFINTAGSHRRQVEKKKSYDRSVRFFERVSTSKLIRYMSTSVSESDEKENDAMIDDEILSSLGTEQPTLPPQPTMELWLDLRGTKIVPKAALLYLTEDDMWDSFISPTRILISKDGVDRAFQHYEDGDPELLYSDDDDSFLRCASVATSPSEKNIESIYGKILNVKDKFMNPLPALETVSEGGWVVVDSDDIKDDEERLESVSDLTSFIAGGFPGGTCAGGIALSCRTKDDIIKLASLLKSTAATASREVTSTESGILIQIDRDVSESPDSNLKCALILPFDALLWKTAAFLVGDSQIP